MKKLKTISLIAVCASVLSISAADYLYFHHGGKVIQRIPAETVERVVKGDDGKLSAVDASSNALYTFAAEDVDSITFSAPLPKADLLDVVFKEDGTAEDVSPMKFTVERGGNATTVWNDDYQCYEAKLEGNKWGDGGRADHFYRIDYTDNQAFKDALADGHTLEVLFMPEYETLPDNEAKIFASHQAGGTGIMIKTKGAGPNNLNALTFLPNVSTGTNSSWQWAASDVVPQSGTYYHVVGVWNKESKKADIYVNGVLSNEIDLEGDNFIHASNGSHTFCIGGDACPISGDNTGVQNGINGRIVRARIYDDALTDEEAMKLYEAAKPVEKPQLPKADLLDVVFKANGVAEDVSPMKFTVERGGNATTVWNDAYNRYEAKLEGNKWGDGGRADHFYRIDYTDNQAFKDALADGHTLEVLFMPEYETLPDNEAKIFASHQAGGTGIMIKTKGAGPNPNNLNALTFLPNVSTGTNSSWQWAASDVVPQSGTYYHVVGVWNKESKKAEIYVNGVLSNEIDLEGDNFIHASNGSHTFCIGGDACPISGDNTGVQNGINGQIVLARIYDDPLTARQVDLLYKASEEVKPIPMPEADLLDVVFKEDGTAEDVSPMKFTVERGGNATTVWNDAYNRYEAKLEGNKWGDGGRADHFYRINYADNQAFKDALADGHTLEVLFMPEYTGAIQNVEAKIFASHEAGGTGIMVKGTWSAPNNLNALTFLPNVSTGTNSSWQWAASDVVPQSGTYYHVVGVWNKDAKKAYIYINGVLNNEIDLEGSNFIHAKDVANFFCIGGDACEQRADNTGVQNGINGRIAVARIYDDPLTAKQVDLLYKASEEVKPVPLPKADLLDVVFKADGVAEDMSPMKFKVERGGETKTQWSDDFNRYVAKLSGNKWGNSDVAEQFYRIDYSDNQKFMDALADGHTLEVLFMPEYTGAIQNVEAKIFASHEAGGTGLMVKTSWNGPNNLNALTFLPNVSTGTNSTWQWAASDVVPEPYAFYHIVGVWDKDAKKAKIYVNGKKKNEISFDGSNFILAKDGAKFFCIGGDACVAGGNKTTGVQNGINGQIVLARIYDDPLTDEQAGLLYKDVEEGVAATHPVIEGVTMLENVQVKAGAVYPVYGTGFEEGDVIVFESGQTRWELPAKINGKEGVTVTFPEDVKSGTFSVMLKRGERLQSLGSVNLLRVKNFENRAHIVAHRGYWAKEGAAQNSRAALRNAIDLKAYGSETDIWMTKDNVLVINHDPSIGGVTIQDANYDDIKDKTLSNGEKLPLFSDYLTILKESDYCKLIVEIKTHSTEARTIEAAKAAVEAVKAAGLEDKAEYIAFDYGTCKALAATYPGIMVQFLCDNASQVRTPAQLVKDGGISIDYNGNMLSSNPTFIDDAHKLGLVVNVWTIRSNEDIGEWINKGVDFITTDIPDLGMKYIEYYNMNKQ